jgi:hypothetical protein
MKAQSLSPEPAYNERGTHMNSTNDSQSLSYLRLSVERQIDEYVYVLPDCAIGGPIPPERIAAGLAEMRASLIDPYWVDVEIRDTFEQCGMSSGPRRRCVAVADDRKGMRLLFDPAEQSFVLAQRTDTGLVTFNVRGDAVGCFLAR